MFRSPDSLGKREIAILPFESMDFSQIGESVVAAALIYGLEPRIVSDFYLTCDRSEVEKERNQRNAKHVLGLTNEQIKTLRADLYLVVTNQDIFGEDSGYVFGFPNQELKTAVISVKRLVRWEEGLAPSKIQERILKEAAHEIGHLEGLNHCPKAGCLMSDSETIEELDSRLPMLCINCSKSLKLLA